MTSEPTPANLGVASPVRTSEKTRARLSDLRPHPGNPRKISPARLAQLQRTLAAEPDLLEARPLIALPDGTVVAGNQRLAAAAALGWESIPVVYADLSPEEVTRWMLLDNRGFGEDDREAVAALLGELGPHRLMCGDATDQADVAALVGTERPAAIWADPPYGIAYRAMRRTDALTATTHRGNSVYDPFAGSGSIVIAAERLSLRALAMEIDPGYCDVIRQRYADYVGDQKWAP